MYNRPMDQYRDRQELKALTLGKKTDYQSVYAPELLQAIPRQLNREELGIVDSQPFSGADVWHAYEMSWLNAKGKPVVALGCFTFNANSPKIVESKSFKLYLNSFNQTHFKSEAAVLEALKRDLSSTCGAEVSITLFPPDETSYFSVTKLPGVCIDDLDIDVTEFDLSAELLSLDPGEEPVEETLHSHLLKSNCLITNQPDWASIVIEYSGHKISHESLLRYLISLRMHNEFHEQCVERIFMDIQKNCSPSALSVQALYTRRGGLDISPYRTTHENKHPPLRRVNRQ